MYGAYFVDGRTTLALEFVNRGSLADVLKVHGAFTPPMMARVAVSMLYMLCRLYKKEHHN
jgi:hypothetical protein